MAYWPARKRSCALANATVTPIDRVPASAAGAMRASWPVSAASMPSTRTCTGMPGVRRATSCVPTLPASSSRARSTMVSTCCSADTFSPGSTWRLATMPAIGASSVASRWPTRVVSSVAWAAASAARAVSTWARELSSALGEMKFCAARRSLLAWVRSAWARLARAESSMALRSAMRGASSAMSMRPSAWPALTRSPSATVSASSVPEVRARSSTVLGATSGPEKAMRSGRLARCGCTTSLARNSSGADAAAPGCLAAWAWPPGMAPGCMATQAPPATASTTTPPSATHACLRMSCPPKAARV